MNLTPYLPPSSGETGAVMALLQVIADPEAAKKALEKMVAERKALENAMEKQRELVAQSESAAKKAAADLDEANRLQATIAQQKYELASNATDVGALSAATNERMQVLSELEKKLSARESDLAGRERSSNKLEKELTQRETVVDRREKKLAEDIAENEKWLASLRLPRGR